MNLNMKFFQALFFLLLTGEYSEASNNVNNESCEFSDVKKTILTQYKSLGEDQYIDSSSQQYARYQNISDFDVSKQSFVESDPKEIDKTIFVNSSLLSEVNEFINHGHRRYHSTCSSHFLKQVSILYKSWENIEIVDDSLTKVKKRECSIPDKIIEDNRYKGNDRDYDILSKQDRWYKIYNSNKKHKIKSSIFGQKKCFTDKDVSLEQKKNLVHCDLSPLTQDEKHLNTDSQFLSKKNLLSLFTDEIKPHDTPVQHISLFPSK